MLPDSTKDEPIAPEATRHDPRTRPAVAASLLLHAGLAFALIRSTLTPSELPEAPVDRLAVRVTIVTESPQGRPPPPIPGVPEEAEAPPPEVTDLIPATEPVSSPPTEDPAPTEAVADARPPAAEGADTDAEREITLDLERLQESISGSMLTYRRDLLDQQMNECQQYRERYARWDCPRGEDARTATREGIDENLDVTFRAWISGYDENERISRELLADMDAMRGLMDDEGVLGDLARERYYLKSVQYTLLNPDEKRTGGFAPVTGGVVKLIGFSLGGITILTGEFLGQRVGMSIGWDGAVKAGEQTRGQALPFDEDEDD